MSADSLRIGRIASDSHQEIPVIESFGGEFLSGVNGDLLEVAFIWSNQVLSVASYERDVTIGADVSSTFVLDLNINKPLVEVHDAGMSVHVPKEADATFWLHDDPWTGDELVLAGLARSDASGGYEVPLAPHIRAVVTWQDYTFLIRLSDPVHLSTHLHVDRDPIPYLGLSALTHMIMLLLIMAMPENAGALELDGHFASDRFVQLALTPEEEEEEPPKWLDDADASASKHSGDEGAAGTEESEARDRKMAIKGSNSPEDLEIRKMRDREIASNAGAAGVFSSGVASLFGSSDQSIGSDAIHALGALEGREFGDSKGVFGAFGIQGGRRGGGGHDEGSIGIDIKTGLSGKKSGVCDGCAADLGGKGQTLPGRVIPLPIASLIGGLDREIIQSVVRRHRREIKSCYQAQLQRNPSLAGQVTVKFTVAPTGRVVVSRTDESTLNNPAAESCINSKIQRWIFPEPEGGGIVVVRYPFRFMAR